MVSFYSLWLLDILMSHSLPVSTTTLDTHSHTAITAHSLSPSLPLPLPLLLPPSLPPSLPIKAIYMYPIYIVYTYQKLLQVYYMYNNYYAHVCKYVHVYIHTHTSTCMYINLYWASIHFKVSLTAVEVVYIYILCI